MIRRRIKRISAAAAILFCGATVQAEAHVMLATPHAAPGSHYVASFLVGHGCEGSATVALRIEVQAPVMLARPRPKPGWTLSIEHAALEKPVKLYGKTVRDRVSAVTWRGRLDDTQFDSFDLLVTLPDTDGTLYFPAIQTCETGQARWTEIPGPDQSAPKRAHPAPALQIGPDPTVPPSRHHH